MPIRILFVKKVGFKQSEYEFVTETETSGQKEAV